MQIKTITTPFILNTSVNCYLIRTEEGYFMVDSGFKGKREIVEREIESAGCRSGNLKRILLTHGDIDHCGNAAYLRQKFGGQIAMHRDDLGMVENGDMFWNRNKPNFLIGMISSLFFKLSETDRFIPDIYIEGGDDLSEYGLDAHIVHLPGHSRGSVGFLTASGDLFCGDLLANINKPELWSIMDDLAMAEVSVEKLKGLGIKTVYPGHGDPFPMAQLLGELGDRSQARFINDLTQVNYIRRTRTTNKYEQPSKWEGTGGDPYWGMGVGDINGNSIEDAIIPCYHFSNLLGLLVGLGPSHIVYLLGGEHL